MARSMFETRAQTELNKLKGRLPKTRSDEYVVSDLTKQDRSKMRRYGIVGDNAAARATKGK